MTLGNDRGVANAVATSTGLLLRPPDICEERKAKKDKYIRRLQRKLASTESISRELFATALKLADNRGLLEAGSAELQTRRDEFRAEIGMLVGRVARLRALALAPRQA